MPEYNETGFEQDLVDHILSKKDAKGSPEKVLSAYDEFLKDTPLMVIGRYKGQIILEEVKRKEPNVMVELGCFIGYSAILFGAEIAKQNANLSKKETIPGKYYSFEVSKKYASMAQKVIDFAGLSETVEIILGPAGQTIPDFQTRLTEEFQVFTPADIVFIDHIKDLYVPDLRVLESTGLIAPGTVILADNVIQPGAPDYIKYVQGSPQYRRDFNESHPNVSNINCQGRWNILYDSKTVPVDNPETGRHDGVEVTRCTSYLSG